MADKEILLFPKNLLNFSGRSIGAPSRPKFSRLHGSFFFENLDLTKSQIDAPAINLVTSHNIHKYIILISGNWLLELMMKFYCSWRPF